MAVRDSFLPCSKWQSIRLYGHSLVPQKPFVTTVLNKDKTYAFSDVNYNFEEHVKLEVETDRRQRNNHRSSPSFKNKKRAPSIPILILFIISGLLLKENGAKCQTDEELDMLLEEGFMAFQKNVIFDKEEEKFIFLEVKKNFDKISEKYPLLKDFYNLTDLVESLSDDDELILSAKGKLLEKLSQRTPGLGALFKLCVGSITLAKALSYANKEKRLPDVDLNKAINWCNVAVEQYKEALKLNPSKKIQSELYGVIGDAYKIKGMLHQNQGNSYSAKYWYKRATWDINKGLENNPKNDRLYYTLAAIYLELKENDEAIKNLNKAIEVASSAWRKSSFHLRLAGIHFSMHNYDQALQQIDCVIKMDSHNPNAYYIAGLVYSKQNAILKAIDSLSKAKTLGADNFEVNSLLGSAFFSNDEILKAIDCYNYALQLKKENIYTYYLRGLAYSKAGRYEQALKDIKYYLDENPNLEQKEKCSILVKLGNIYFMMMNIDKSLECLDKALSIEAENQDAIKLQLHILSKLEDSMANEDRRFVLLDKASKIGGAFEKQIEEELKVKADAVTDFSENDEELIKTAYLEAVKSGNLNCL